ncbi:MAG TPA: DNA repair and recombination protein RadA [Nitrososphaeraceae archaeon]
MSNKSADSSFLDLNVLEDIGPATKICLQKAGFRSLKDLVIRGATDIASATGISTEKCANMCNKARMILEDLGIYDKPFVPATVIYDRRKSESRISSGSKNLDNLLGGGIETRSITELYGEFGSGKTQICHTLCVSVQKNAQLSRLTGNALYIDTENTFRPERIVSIANARNLNPEPILENIIVAKAYNSSHQEAIIEEAANVIQLHGIRLLVVDSAVSHYRAEYLGRALLSERQQKMNRFLHILLRIAETCSVAVVITNQIQSSPDSLFGDPFRPTGGNIMGHTTTYRIYLKRAGKNRIARMADSPYHAEREVLFTLNEEGIGDPIH